MLGLLFWVLVILAIYSYFLYPLLLVVLQKCGYANDVAGSQGEAEVSISLIVTAYNESARIRKKLDNAIVLDYAPDKLEIIVASDCSDDGTDDIVREYQDKGVKLVRAAERLGKENAQREAIQKATGDILVFSDVATDMPQDSLVALSRYFSDPAIGAVSSEDRFVSQDGSVAGEGAYVKYEMWLRQQESKLAGLVGLSGSFFAARKVVCQEWDIHSPSDFNTALNCARLGYRSVTAPDVLGYYQDLKDPSKEYARKVRTVIRGMTALSRHPEVMSVSSFGLFAVQVISHKLMRWLVPWFLVALFIVSAVLAGSGFIYTLAFIAQLVFYGLSIAAHYSSAMRENPLVKLIYFFVQVNISLFDAACKFLSGTRMTTWKPSAR